MLTRDRNNKKQCVLNAIDFDDNNNWAPSLTKALKHVLPADIEAQVSSNNPDYVGDARDTVFSLAGRDQIIEAALGWVRSNHFYAYHGTRLTKEEVCSVQKHGLRVLTGRSRAARLARALRRHASWPEVYQKLDQLLDAHGKGCRSGSREGQANLTLSRSSLLESFNHYLQYGSEFDQHVAYDLLDDEGLELLANDGNAVLLKFSVPGPQALASAHPFVDIDMLRRQGDIPNVVQEFLDVWSYSLANPKFQAREIEVNCGLHFNETVPPHWLVGIEPVNILIAK